MLSHSYIIRSRKCFHDLMSRTITVSRFPNRCAPSYQYPRHHNSSLRYHLFQFPSQQLIIFTSTFLHTNEWTQQTLTQRPAFFSTIFFLLVELVLQMGRWWMQACGATQSHHATTKSYWLSAQRSKKSDRRESWSWQADKRHYSGLSNAHFYLPTPHNPLPPNPTPTN